MAENLSYNQIQRKGNPLYEFIKARLGTELGEDMFYIPAINFPQWFISVNSEIKPLNEWRKEWQIRKCNDGKMTYFVPPRDPNKKTSRKIKAEVLHDDIEYGLLKPVPLILICPNGHISDIPWYKFFCASLKHEKMDDDAGFELFGYDCEDCSCGGKHNIKWLNSRNQAESWGTLKCSKCERSVSLAGIMNIKPYCRGERPWVNRENTYERCLSMGQKTKMQVAMVTSNSIYYASGFSSLYIPKDFIPQKSGQLNDEARTALSKVIEKYNAMIARKPGMSKKEFWEKKYNDCDDFIEDANINWQCNLTDIDYENIKNLFLGLMIEEEDNDPVATYRLTEFEVLTDVNDPNRKSKGLEFNEIISLSVDSKSTAILLSSCLNSREYIFLRYSRLCEGVVVTRFCSFSMETIAALACSGSMISASLEIAEAPEKVSFVLRSVRSLSEPLVRE